MTGVNKMPEPGSAWGRRRCRGPWTLPAAKETRAWRAGWAKAIAGKKPLRPAARDQRGPAPIKAGSECQGPGRLYLAVSGVPGRDIVPGKFVS